MIDDREALKIMNRYAKLDPDGDKVLEDNRLIEIARSVNMEVAEYLFVIYSRWKKNNKKEGRKSAPR